MTEANIAIFILARVAEREADADEIHDRDCTLITMGVGHGWCDCPQPERVRARCAVDRQIVDMCRDLDGDFYSPDAGCLGDAVLEALASLDADHPDYNKDWKP